MSEKKYLHPNVFKYIEHELYNYTTSKRELANIREEILESSASQEVCVQSTPSSSVESKVVKLTSSVAIAKIERVILAVDRSLVRLKDDHQMLFDLKYKQGRSWQQVCIDMPCSESSCYNIRRELVFAVADALGFIFLEKPPKR